MYSDGNRSGYGAVLLIMVGDMLISSSNLDSQMCPLWMTFFYIFKLLWFDFPAVTDTCCHRVIIIISLAFLPHGSVSILSIKRDYLISIVYIMWLFIRLVK